MEQTAHAQRERAERETSFAEADSRRDLASRYEQDAETTRRESRKLDKIHFRCVRQTRLQERHEESMLVARSSSKSLCYTVNIPRLGF